MQDWEPGTGDDLIGDAEHRGVPMSERTLTLWRDQGLLAAPQRVGQGRGLGVRRVYSAAARQVFNTVLAHRHDTKTAPLTRIVVGVWIYWGDDWVSWAQAERALATWIEHYRTSPGTRAERDAGNLLEAIADPDAGPEPRRHLTDLVKQAQRSGKIKDANALTEAVRAVLDPHNTGRRLGAPGNSVSPEQMLTAWLANQAATTQLHGHLKRASKRTTHGRLFPPRVRAGLHAARDELTTSLTEYGLMQPHLAALDSPEQARWAQPAEPDQLLSNGCSNLLSTYHRLRRGVRP